MDGSRGGVWDDVKVQGVTLRLSAKKKVTEDEKLKELRSQDILAFLRTMA